MKGRKKRKAVPKVWCDQCGDWHSVACPTPGEIEDRSAAVQEEWSPRIEQVHRGAARGEGLEAKQIFREQIHGHRLFIK